MYGVCICILPKRKGEEFKRKIVENGGMEYETSPVTRHHLADFLYPDYSSTDMVAPKASRMAWGYYIVWRPTCKLFYYFRIDQLLDAYKRTASSTFNST